MKLSERMIQYRAKNNLSQSALAELCGLSKMTVHSLESEQQDGTNLTVAKIELVIGKEEEE